MRKLGLFVIFVLLLSSVVVAVQQKTEIAIDLDVGTVQTGPESVAALDARLVTLVGFIPGLGVAQNIGGSEPVRVIYKVTYDTDKITQKSVKDHLDGLGFNAIVKLWGTIPAAPIPPVREGEEIDFAWSQVVSAQSLLKQHLKKMPFNNNIFYNPAANEGNGDWVGTNYEQRVRELRRLAAQGAATKATSTSESGSEKKVASNGVKLTYQPTAEYSTYSKLLIDAEFSKLVDYFNDLFAWPADVEVIFDTCSEANAFFSGRDRKILICYQLLDEFNKILIELGFIEDDIPGLVVDATIHTFYHEMGHALVDVLDLPITGNKEDAIDELATLLLIDSDERAAASATATTFLIEDAENELALLPFWDQHSWGPQRFHNTHCLLYGENPQANSDLINEGYLTQQKAQTCKGEFDQALDIWFELLDPYVLDG